MWKFLTDWVLLLGISTWGSPAVEEKPRLYELRGNVLSGEGEPFKETTPVAFLQGAATPFSSVTLVDRGGNFKFSKLKPMTYRIIIAVPKWGEMEQTIEIGPSFADSKGRIHKTLHFKPSPGTDAGATISTRSLTIPKTAIRAYTRAEQALENQDTEKALAHLEEAVKIAPEYSAAWNRLGTIAYLSGRYQDSESYFKESLRCAPDSYAPLVNLGAAFLSLGKLEQALEKNERAVRMRPDDALARSQLGQTLFALGKMNDAESELRKAISLDPGHFSYPRLVLAEICRRRQDYVGVVRDLEEFLKYHPDAKVAPRIKHLLELAQREAGAAP